MLMSTATLLLIAPIQGQAIDTAYARMVRAATTDERFLPANVATLPDHPGVPSPLDHFGVIAGAPGVAHTTAELYGYYRALASASPRVSVETVGRSEGGRDILLIVIADEATISDIERYKADVAALADPRRIDRAEMERIVARAKPIYNLQAGQHSPEMGPPEMVPELAYRLAVSEDPTIRLIRENVITLLSPVTEPDGRDRQVEWYYRHTKDRTDWNDGFPRSVPYWGQYIYHDNNRDGIQVTSELTKTSYSVYFEWHPTVMHDMHESVPLLYVSMGTGPYNRNIDPITKAEWLTLANWDVQHVTQQGLSGAWTWGFYDGWWRGYQTWIAANHNGIGRFFETYGNASPDTYVRDLSGSRFAGDPVTTEQWYRPDPPPRKVLWSLRNNTNYMQAGALSSLEYAARNGKEMLRNFWQKGTNSIERGLTEAPYAFVIPALDSQRDPRRAAYLVNQLMRHGIEVQRVVRSDDTLRGSFVVLSNQPYRDFAVDLLTRQDYPQDAEYVAPDVAWTLGLIYGAEVRSVDTPDVFTWTGLERVRDTVAFVASAAAGSDDERGTWALRYTGQAELLPALAALESRNRQVQAFGAAESFTAGGTQWDVGTVILERLGAADASWLATTYGLPLTQIADAPSLPRHRIDLPRLAVYHTWVSTQDEGWVRYWFDQLQVPYTSIDKDDLRAGNLRDRFDVIVVPPGRGDVTTWIHGVDSKWSPLPYTATSEYPSHGTPSSTDDMTGGPGFEGLAELERFLDGGGTIITLANGGNLAIGTGLVRELTPLNAAGLVHPTSVVRVTARRPNHPVLFGYPAVTHVLRGNGPLWRTARRDRSTLVLQYGSGPQADERDTLVAEIVGMPETAGGGNVPAQAPQSGERPAPYVLSGMVRNSDRIMGHGAVFDVPAGRNNAGRVVVFTFNPVHRYLNHHDAPMLLNAILYWNDVTTSSPGAQGR